MSYSGPTPWSAAADHLKDAAALVTGASAGIGRGIAIMLARLGLKVVLVARREEALLRTAAEIANMGHVAIPISADVRDETQLRMVLERARGAVGHVDVLVNNAGLVKMHPIHDTDLEVWDSVMQTNLRAAVVLCSALLPGMRERRRGWIINVSSEAGAMIYPGMGAYCVSKHALRVLTELIQVENDSYGIKAWAICPGDVATSPEDWIKGEPSDLLIVDDVVGVLELLLTQRQVVKMGPSILMRLMPRKNG